MWVHLLAWAPAHESRGIERSIGRVERVVVGCGVLDVGVGTEVMRGVRSSAILES